MKAAPWRLLGRPAGGQAGRSADTLDGPTGAPRLLAARIVAVEPIAAPVSALLLLLAPNPLVWPAAVAGALPSIARLLATGRPWRASAFDLPVLLLAIGALLGGYASLSQEGATIRLTGLLAAFILFAALREHAHGERALRRLVVGMLAGAVLCSLLMLVLVGPFLRLDHVPPLAAIVGAVDRWRVGEWFVDQDWLLQRYRFRASGVGALADVGLALSVAALVGLRGHVARTLTALSVPLFVLVLVVADNRGAMLAGAITLGLMATVWRRRLLPLAPVVAGLVLLVLAFGPFERGLSLKTLAQRFWFWENSLYLAREVPLTGAGLGLESVQLVYRAYFQPSYPPFSHAHNIYLQGLLEYGIFGLAGLIGLALAALWLGWRAPLPPDRWTLAGRLAGFGAALAMLTSGLTEIVLLSTVGGAIALGALGLLAATTGPLVPTPSSVTRDAHCGAGTPLTPRPPLPHAGEGEQRSVSPSPSQGGGRGDQGDVGQADIRAPQGPWDRRSGVLWTPRRDARRVGGRGSLGGRGLVVAGGAAVLLLLAGVLAATGLGQRIGARLLLNAGTADLNRGALSETIRRDDRSTALERAVSELRLASSLDPNDVTIQRNLALALAANDDARRARAVVDRAKALTSTSSRADLFQLGRAYAALSAWGETIRAWQAAEAAPQLIQLGNRLIRARNYDQAINAFIATARVDPRSRGAYEGVARASREGKASVDETVQALGPLLEPGSPTELGARLQAARVLREDGRLQEAGRHLRRAEEISAPPELSFEYGMLWLAAGIPQQAVSLLVRPAADLPLDPENWLWLARAQAALGDHEAAVGTIVTGLTRVDPSGQFAPPAERLPETAAVRAVEIKRTERAPLLGVLGESLVRLGRAGEALPVLEEAVAALPKDAWLARTLAEARAVEGGAPPNLLLNPSFDREGSWAIRVPNWQQTWLVERLVNETPHVDDGQARLALALPETRFLAQEVFRLVPGRQYRATVRLRAEGLGSGAVAVFLADASGSVVAQRVVTAAETAQWTTVSLEGAPDPPPSSSLAVVVGFAPGTPAGAVLWCDEATLTALGSQR